MSTHRKRFSSPPQLHLLCHLPHRTLRPELHRNDSLWNGATSQCNIPQHMMDRRRQDEAWKLHLRTKRRRDSRRKLGEDETGRWRENLRRGLMRVCSNVVASKRIPCWCKCNCRCIWTGCKFTEKVFKLILTWLMNILHCRVAKTIVYWHSGKLALCSTGLNASC